MNKIKWAEKKAYQLLNSLEIDSAPIPVEDIVKALNIKLTKSPFEEGKNFSGVLYRDKSGKSIIGVNARESDKRQRFTIAHEIGHFIMHEGDLHIDENFRVNFRDANSSLAINKEEIEANAFAAALLMPEELLKRALKEINQGIDFSDDNDTIKNLSELFQVSEQALLIRLGKLGVVI